MWWNFFFIIWVSVLFAKLYYKTERCAHIKQEGQSVFSFIIIFSFGMILITDLLNPNIVDIQFSMNSKASGDLIFSHVYSYSKCDICENSSQFFFQICMNPYIDNSLLSWQAKNLGFITYKTSKYNFFLIFIEFYYYAISLLVLLICVQFLKILLLKYRAEYITL